MASDAWREADVPRQCEGSPARWGASQLCGGKEAKGSPRDGLRLPGRGGGWRRAVGLGRKVGLGPKACDSRWRFLPPTYKGFRRPRMRWGSWNRRCLRRLRRKALGCCGMLLQRESLERAVELLVARLMEPGARVGGETRVIIMYSPPTRFTI